jgi:DNA-binding NarL/FixJ family response regulator
MDKIRLILADDHSILRYGLRLFLSKSEDIEVAGEASSGEECLKLYKREEPDLCLIDIEMPGKNGIEVVKSIRRNDSEVKLIMLSMHSGKETLQNAITAGANGYILKDTSKKDILKAIRSVMSGEEIISDSLMNTKATEKSVDEKRQMKNITDREMQVLQLVVAGYSSSQIADKLFISRRTVDTHRNNIMKKLDLHNTASLVRFALQNNLVEASKT